MSADETLTGGNAAPPAYAAPDNLAWVDGADHGLEDDLFLTTVPDGHTVLLRGSARLIWLSAVASSNPLAELSEVTGLEADELATDVNAFLADLVQKRLLVEIR